MADSRETNYVTANRFYVEIQSQLTASFSECSGLGVKVKADPYLEGGVNDQQRITLGHAEFSDVTLKRGVTDDSTFSHWLSEVFKQTSQRRNVNILVFNQAGDLMKSWTLIGAIPIGWKISPLQADGNSVAIEELTLAIEGLKIGKSSAGGESATRDASGFFASSAWG